MLIRRVSRRTCRINGDAELECKGRVMRLRALCGKCEHDDVSVNLSLDSEQCIVKIMLT